MLSKPEAGWSDFQLKDTSSYSLSYLDDIAFEWIDKAIYGLETLYPFCVKGPMEPGRFICIVSYWNCYIFCEDEGRLPLDKENVINEYSHTNMLQFCQSLYDDISQNIDEWVSFVDYLDEDIVEKKMLLIDKLIKLRELMMKREVNFREGIYFL